MKWSRWAQAATQQARRRACASWCRGHQGGVGSALVQLLKRRQAEVIAGASASRIDEISRIGADRVLARDADPVEVQGAESIDVVIDNVARPGLGIMLKLLRRSGRYVTSGAIAGPIVSLDLRDLDLKDNMLIGCTAWDAPVLFDPGL